MNSNTVLGRIANLLSLKSEEVALTYAKLADGTILESSTFDVGELVEVVSEDGTKSPAPDGEHELELTGAEGETVRFKIITEGGVITERENVELEDIVEDEETELEAETVKVDEEITQALEAVEETEEEMVEETEEKEEVTINLEEVVKKVEDMAYRISELEKTLKAAEEEIKEEEMEEEEDEEIEAKKLDGAPVDTSKFSKVQKDSFKKSYHSSVLEKLYNR
jgi:flagellar biosynthesis GTPase FlhF